MGTFINALRAGTYDDLPYLPTVRAGRGVDQTVLADLAAAAERKLCKRVLLPR